MERGLRPLSRHAPLLEVKVEKLSDKQVMKRGRRGREKITTEGRG
jgi:hypothetical protein